MANAFGWIHSGFCVVGAVVHTIHSWFLMSFRNYIYIHIIRISSPLPPMCHVWRMKNHFMNAYCSRFIHAANFCFFFFFFLFYMNLFIHNNFHSYIVFSPHIIQTMYIHHLYFIFIIFHSVLFFCPISNSMADTFVVFFFLFLAVCHFCCCCFHFHSFQVNF